MAIKQTAGRDALGEFAPKFAQLNDEFAQYFSGSPSIKERYLCQLQ